MKRFKGLELVSSVPEELWTKVCNTVEEAMNKTIPKKKKSKKAKWLPKEALQIDEEQIDKEVKNKGERERSVQFSSVAQSHLTLCDPMNRSMPGFPVHRQLQEFTQTHVHRVGDAIQPSHSLSSHCPPTPNPFQHQGLFQ